MGKGVRGNCLGKKLPLIYSSLSDENDIWWGCGGDTDCYHW